MCALSVSRGRLSRGSCLTRGLGAEDAAAGDRGLRGRSSRSGGRVLLDELAGLLRELLGVGTELVERLEEAVDVHGEVLSVVVTVQRPSSGRGI